MARHFKQQKQVVYNKRKNDEPKAEKEVISADGRVMDLMPNAEFLVELLDEAYNKHQLKAKISGRMRMNNIKILLGDYVTVDLNPYDLTRGRITYRHRQKPVPAEVETDETIPPTKNS